MSEKKKKKMTIKISKLQLFQAISAILAVALVIVFVSGTVSGATAWNINSVGKKTAKMINNNFLPQGVEATYVNGTIQDGVYKILIDVQGQGKDQKSYVYISGSNSLLFPTAIELSKLNAEPQQPQQQTPAQQQNVPKSDKPNVELFVMSYCPFGTQIEKGIIPVVNALGDKIDFSVKFCSYSMHGEKELRENMLQTCIQQDYKDKYLNYLECFLNSSDSNTCVEKMGFDNATLTNCVDNLDKEYNVTEMFNDKSTWLSGRYPMFNVFKSENDLYGVQGSPTLVINGVKVQSGRDSASLMGAICNAFNNAPEACNTNMSSVAPSAGFGYSNSGSGSGSGSCG